MHTDKAVTGQIVVTVQGCKTEEVKPVVWNKELTPGLLFRTQSAILLPEGTGSSELHGFGNSM